jgi:hypothetical protein
VEEDGTLAAARVDNQVGHGGDGVGPDLNGGKRVRLLHAGAIGTNRPELKRGTQSQWILPGEGKQLWQAV